MTTPAPIESFIARWSAAGGSERANYQLFVAELCELLDLPKPEPARDDARDNAYVFERRVIFRHGDGGTSNGFIDCYRRACFILEAKQTRLTESVGKTFDDALLRARSLDPAERHSLGAEYTPRPYVERLVLPTVIEPLRSEWENVKAATLLLANGGKTNEARDTLHAFHHRLCQVKVLDPACGTANFLYVTLEHLKRLEGEVLDLLDQLGDNQGQGRLETEGLTVDPHQFLGLELNPRAAAIAELVLWIGYLQWHYRTRGNVRPPEPVLRDFRNIECRDAVLAMHENEGQPAEWPSADYVVGNPPFIGASTMRAALGDAYVEALRTAYPDVPDSADLVMFWWHKAAALVATGKLKQFGLITTNSLRQTFNRRVIERALTPRKPLSPRERGGGEGKPHPPDDALDRATAAPSSPALPPRGEGRIHLAFAIADHPWVDGSDGAAVRIAMTVGAGGTGEGRLLTVTDERATGGEGLASQNEGRVVVTLDKDFGELAIVRGLPHAGIIRLVGFAARQQGTACLRILERYGAEIAAGAIVTADPGRVRIRNAE